MHEMLKFRMPKKALALGVAAALLQPLTAGAEVAIDPWLSLNGLETQTRPTLKGVKKGLRVVKARVVNTSDRPIVGPVRLVVEDANREVVNADYYTADGEPVFILSDDPDYTLAPGAKSEEVSIEFKRPSFRELRTLAQERDLRLRVDLAAELQPFTVQLLHNADMDGATGALQNVKNFSAILEALRNEAPERTLTLSSGDNYIPGPRFAAASDPTLDALLGKAGEGRGDIAFLNAMGYQASAVGNHDLDPGTAGFAGIISPDGAYLGAQFPYLSANLDFTTDPNLVGLVRDDGQPAATIPNSLASSTTITVDGETIGVVGATTPTLASITSTGDITVKPAGWDGDVATLAAEIQPAVDALTAQGIDKVILLAHMQQIGVEKELATLLNDVDIIVAGGSNTLLADANDRLRDDESDAVADTYPLAFTSPKGEPVLVVNTDGDYEYLGRLVAGFDGAGVIVEESLDDTVNGVYAADDTGAAGLSPNPQVAAVADALGAVLAARDGNILGNTAVYLDGRRSQVRTQETNLGNLTADANLWLGQQFDPSVQVSLKNGGGIRDDIGYFVYPPGSTDPNDLEFLPPNPNPDVGKEEGDISQFDIEGSLRFNNGLTLLTLTAAELAANIEHGVADAGPGVTSGRFPQVGGIRFSWDPALPGGDRVQSLVVVNDDGSVADVVVQDGALVGDPDRTFRMVTLDFLYNNCGDGYPLPGCNGGAVPTTVAPNVVYLTDAGLPDGDATFAAAGSEQDALAEYLLAEYPDSANAFDLAETPAAEDERIQNLSERADSVLP